MRNPLTLLPFSLRGVLVAGALLLAAPVSAQRGPAARVAPPSTFQLRALPANADGSRPTLAVAQPALRRALVLRPQDELRALRTETDELDGVHVRYQQYFRGVKVEHGVVTLHARGNELQTLSGDVLTPPATLAVQPGLAEAAARERALAAVGAKRYMWEDAAEEAALRQRTNDAHASFFPTGELVLVADRRAAVAGMVGGAAPLVLAWKFNVYARQPISRELLYVDARTGEVVLRDAIIKHVNAPATMATKYSGVKPGTTDAFGGGFRLRETAHGKGVTTLNCQEGTSFAAAVDFIDNDNNWTAAEYNNSAQDNAALDAHLGAAATQDYWTTQHGRDSFDDRGSVLLSYVHFDRNFENAFWDGTEMVYGDGGFRFSALTCVDVCGHEIGHAVCETTAGLVYEDESGALNEALSDIWGACIEHHFDPTKQTWLLGEDIDLLGVSLRSMSNPNDEQQPDTYEGDFWYTGPDDNGGVHTNSGVLNYWFYLLSVGGSGANDNGTPFLVNGITIQKAAKIAYRAERLYMTPTTNYPAAVRCMLQAAVDLYGLSSPEVTAVAQAWRAVGLGDGTPAVTTMTPTSGPIGTVVTLSGTNLATAYRVTFNGTAATRATLTSASQLTVDVPPGATTGSVVVTTAAGPASAGVFTVTSTGPVPALLSYTPAAGAPQGATVIITGANLTGATAVTFNGVTATFTVNSATQIAATVPATATSGPLRVTTSGGRATAPNTFLVLPKIVTFAPAAGAVGTAVVLTGTSFTGALDVKFNGTYATFMVASAARINVTVPAGATTGPITVRTPSGTATSATPFTVTPTLGISSFTPGSGAPLTTIVTIYGRGFTGTTLVKFNNTPATTFTVASDTELWATVPTGATTGPIRVTSPLGTVNSTNSFQVLVPGAPRIDDFTPKLGPVGTTVTITGLDFLPATAVKFNGTPATVVSKTNTRIIATVPAGATTGQISITAPLGTGVSSLPFRVVVPPVNDLCTAAAVPVLTCGSVVTGSTLGSTTTGDPTGGCTESIDGPGVFYSFIGTGQSVTATTCGGITDYDSKLHVFSGTCGNLTCLTGNDDECTTVRTNSTVTFTAALGTPYFLFVSGWNGLAGDFTLSVNCTGTAPTTPTIAGFTPTSGPVGTVVTLTGTDLSGVTAVRFGTVAATTFAVNPAGTQLTATVPSGAGYAPLILTTASGTTTSTGSFCTQYAATATGASRCGTGTVTLTASGAPTGGSYRWYTAATGGTPLTPTTGTFTTPSLSATTTYYVAARTSGGCEGPRRAVTATINAAPTAQLAASGPTTFCAGGAVTLTASGPAGATYQFRRNGTALAGATGATYSATQAGVYTVQVTVATCAATSGAVTVTVNPVPGAAFAYGAASFCRGGTNPTPTVTGAAGGVFSAAPTGLTLNATTGAINLGTSAAGTYVVSYAISGACPAVASQSLTVTAAPVAAFSYAAGGSFCAGAPQTLLPTLGAGATAGTFVASPAGLSINPTTGAVDLSASAPGTYTIENRIAASGACPVVTAMVPLTVAPVPPTPVVTQAPQPGGLVQLTSSATTGNQWYLNGTAIIAATSPTYTVGTAAQNGVYTVVSTSAAGCASATSAGQTVTITGTAAETSAPAWALWPNPARERVSITGAAPRTALTLIDATGRPVRTVTTSADGAATLDVAGLARGMYAVRAGGRTRRLIIE